MRGFVFSAAAAAAAAAACFRRRRCQYGSSSCSSDVAVGLWRRTISNCRSVRNPSNNHYDDYCGKQQQEEEEAEEEKKQQQLAPCLLLSSPSNPQYRYLFEMRSHGCELKLKLKRQIKLMLEEHFFIGSSHGYLISIDLAPSPSIHIFNPLLPTIRAITLPPPPPLRRSDNHSTRQLCKVWKTPFVDFVTVDSSFSKICDGKALLSPSLDTIVLLRDGELPLIAPLNPLQQQSDSVSVSVSDSVWTEMSYHDYRSHPTSVEAIFHKGRLYTITHDNFLYVYNLDYKNSNTLTLANGKHGFPNFSLQNDPFWDARFDLHSSLVESPDGDDLFLVYRGIKHEKNDEEEAADWIACHFGETNSCKVFKLTFNTKLQRNEWHEVETIGDLAFFVGYRSTSLSIDVGSHPQSFPFLKPNSVYFSDSFGDHWMSLDPDDVGDAGVCNLEDGTIQYIELFDGHQQLNWPPPVWYMPSPPPPPAI